MTNDLSIDDRGDVRWITLNNPPVNALSASLKTALLDAVQTAGLDPAVGAIVLRGAGGRFSAGADIPAFKTGKMGPRIASVAQAIEDTGKPAIALIEGFALGGGLELALGCTARLGATGALLGLPEVALGILPGAGGLQRLPRLIGLAAAAELILSGEKIGVEAAADRGIVDHVVESEAFDSAVAELLADESILRREPLSKRALIASGPDYDVLRRLGETLGGRRGPSRSQGVILDRLSQSIDVDFETALAADAKASAELRDGPESAALRHLFAAERMAVRVQDNRLKGEAPSRVAVAGAGTMGTGIAITAALAGIPVLLFDPDDEARDKADRRIAAFVERRVAKGRMSATEGQSLRALFTLVGTIEDLGSADLVVEAIVENLDVKRDFFRGLEQVCAPETVFASNTSFLELDKMAVSLAEPGRLIGLHFFAPAEIMQLLEAVRAARSSDAAFATGLAFGRAIGKTTIPMKDCSGFAANRSRFPMMNEARLIVEDGADPAQVDGVLRGFGFPMGPFETNDQGGLDIYVKGYDFVPKALRPGRQSRLPFAMVKAGRLGHKSGSGYYRYENGSRTPQPDPALQDILTQFRVDNGIVARSFSDQEILERCLFAAVNASVLVVNDGIIARPDDMDVVWVQGFAFPREKGGILHWAGTIGFDHIERRIAEDFRNQDPDRWPLADFSM